MEGKTKSEPTASRGGIKIAKTMALFIALSIASIYVFQATNPFSHADQCPELSDSELRMRVIKSLLSIKLDRENTRPKPGSRDELRIIDRSISKQEIIDRISDKSIMDIVSQPGRIIREKNDIDALGDIVRGSGFSILSYSEKGRYLEIIPGNSIRALNREETEYYRNQFMEMLTEYNKKNRFIDIGVSEKYPEHVFSIEINGFINLACCDGLDYGSSQSPSQHAKRSINTLLLDERMKFITNLMVSDCGELVTREVDGYNSYFFNQRTN